MKSEFDFEIEQHQLKRAKNAARILNWIAGIAAAWIIFFAEPYDYVIWTVIALPLILLIALFHFKGLLSIREPKKSTYPSVFFAFFILFISGALRGLIDYNIYDYSNVWLPMFAIGIFISLTIIIASRFDRKQSKSFYAIVFTLFLMACGYGYGCVVISNCFYDNSVPKNYRVEVLDKRVHSGKSKSHYLSLSAWGPEIELNEQRVSKGLFNRCEIGDSIWVSYHHGAYDIPWIRISK